MMINKEKLQFIPNNERYYEFIRELRSHPDLVSGFVQQGKITSEQQKEYMKKHGHEYYICLYDKEPVGFIGSVNKDIRLAVKKEFQRMGIASFMLSEISKIISDYEVKVKSDNIKSLGFFEKNGFMRKYTEIVDNKELVILEKVNKDDIKEY